MTPKLFPCLYPLEKGSECSGANDVVVINESINQNNFPFCASFSCCPKHLSSLLNPPKQQQQLINGQHLNLANKCPCLFHTFLAVELFCRGASSDYASNGCLIRYLELRMNPNQVSQLVEYQAQVKIYWIFMTFIDKRKFYLLF